MISTLTTRIARPDDEVAAHLARPSIAARLTPPWFPPNTIFDDRLITTHIDPDGPSACHLTEELTASSLMKNEECIMKNGQTTETTPAITTGAAAPHSTFYIQHSTLEDGGGAAALAYRHATLRDDLEHTAPYGHVRRLRIAIAGATGLIGRALTTFLQTQNHEVIPITASGLMKNVECSSERSEKPDMKNGQTSAREATATPSPATGAAAPSDHSTFNILLSTLGADGGGHAAIDAVINLAGAPIDASPWTQPLRDQIWQSRAATTRALVAALATLNPRPFAYLNASSLAIYGTRGHDPLDETAPLPPRNTGFLSDVFAGAEHESLAAADLGIRTVLLRFAHVLTPAGGPLARYTHISHLSHSSHISHSPLKLSPLGHGRQWTSWITIDDAIAAIYHALLTHTISGPVNITSPTPLTNADLTAALAAALHQKPRLARPRWLLRLRHGADFANETLLASQRLAPAKLQATAYTFRHPTIETALAHLLP